MSPDVTVLVYFLTINLVALFAFWLDKHRSVNGKTRISGRSLLLLVAMGGTFGGWRAMSLYNHKSRNHSFRRVFGLIAFAQLCFALLYFYIRMPQEWKDTILKALNV